VFVPFARALSENGSRKAIAFSAVVYKSHMNKYFIETLSSVRIEDAYERPADRVHKTTSSIRSEKTALKTTFVSTRHVWKVTTTFPDSLDLYINALKQFPKTVDVSISGHAKEKS